MSRLKNVNKQAHKILVDRFEEMCLNGSFPEVEFCTGESASGLSSRSFALFEYSRALAKLCRLAHTKLLLEGFEWGLWQNARNEHYLSKVRRIAEEMTESEVNSTEGFKTIWD